VANTSNGQVYFVDYLYPKGGEIPYDIQQERITYFEKGGTLIVLQLDEANM
jgi:hypothetical protein